ncbi:hypothetical protein [Stygiobacter electus]|uniref:Uncharacterized protein n=1 Tax=Stygiobacter electus TaxID=3032292 RepID=A0AAE3TCW0_9BACT|nr:hypothetical protein [Stygiobacter electus]MDF1612823.1 hypothetical protein [Stygiobacter electus]
MKSLNDFIGEQLFFIKPKLLKNYYELKLGDETIGYVEVKGFFKNKAYVKIFDKEFIFIQASFWRSILEIKELGKEISFASYNSKLFKDYGFIDLPMGESLKVSYSFFNSNYDLRNSLGEILIQYSNKFPFKTRTDVSIEKKSQILEKYPWVIFIPFFVKLERSKNSRVI